MFYLLEGINIFNKFGHSIVCSETKTYTDWSSYDKAFKSFYTFSNEEPATVQGLLAGIDTGVFDLFSCGFAQDIKVVDSHESLDQLVQNNIQHLI